MTDTVNPETLRLAKLVNSTFAPLRADVKDLTARVNAAIALLQLSNPVLVKPAKDIKKGKRVYAEVPIRLGGPPITTPPNPFTDGLLTKEASRGKSALPSPPVPPDEPKQVKPI